MNGGIAGRVGLAVLAVLAASWLAYDLRAVSLDAQGRAAARMASHRSQVDHALSLFKRASRGNLDPTPRLDQARLLLAVGRTVQAVDVLNGVVRTNPGNVLAWSLLASAAAANDPRRAAQADDQLRILFGHPVVYRAGQGSILTPGGVVAVIPGRIIGIVESTRVTGAVTHLVGWSAAATKQAGGGWSVMPTDEILIVSDGRLIGGGTPTVTRPDISRDLLRLFGASIAPAGFRIDVPSGLVKRLGRKAGLHVFGVSQRIASEIPLHCRTSVQAFGCVP